MQGLAARPLPLMSLVTAVMLFAAACSSDDHQPTLFVGGIPDQDVSMLEARFDLLAEHLSEELGVEVDYLPSVEYAAVVTGFRNDNIQLAWYGGLTGVQARIAVTGAQAFAQRDIDENFTSVFVAAPGSGIESPEDLAGESFTFGSISSTSGHLMPRFFLYQAGITPEDDLAQVSYSGSHDRTWKLVEAGTFDAGALNANVWRTRLEAGEIDRSRVDVFFTTPGYFDYHWVVRPGLDEVHGEGFTARLRNAILELDASNGGRDKDILDAFQTARFIPTHNENYASIESAARAVDLLE